jgi:hypothetical protein
VGDESVPETKHDDMAATDGCRGRFRDEEVAVSD